MHLPEALRPEFKRLVGEFIWKVFKYHEKKAHKENEITNDDLAEAMILEGSETAPKKEVTGLMDDVEDFKKEFDHDYICNLISEYFSLKLMGKVESFHMRRKQN
mmetsp:Transcript_6900/g.9542  ORF Transcript_6900/g.9542 Transcript_6900/m.9542 type:complete len:104 (-) Transcript_6900:361-672(-)